MALVSCALNQSSESETMSVLRSTVFFASFAAVMVVARAYADGECGTYPNCVEGTLCVSGTTYVCHKQNNSCGPVSTIAGCPDGKSGPKDSAHQTAAKDSSKAVTAKTISCFVEYANGTTNSVGLRNTCGDCKIADINFIYNNGKNQVKQFKVNAHASITVDITGTQMTQIIDEEACS
jgi:hypothetical protein